MEKELVGHLFKMNRSFGAMVFINTLFIIIIIIIDDDDEEDCFLKIFKNPFGSSFFPKKKRQIGLIQSAFLYFITT